MTNCKVGDLVLVPFPFTDLSTTKQRPALLLEKIESKSSGTLYICSMITSQIDGELITGDVILKEWQTSGLLHPSKVRLSKMVTLETKIIKKNLGKLGESDSKKISRELKKVFSDWI